MCLISKGRVKERKKDRFVYKVVKRDVTNTNFEFLFRGANGHSLSELLLDEDLSLVRNPAAGFYARPVPKGYMSFLSLKNAKNYCATLLENGYSWISRICIVRLVLQKEVLYEEGIIDSQYIGCGLYAVRSQYLFLPEFKFQKNVNIVHKGCLTSYYYERKKLVETKVPYYY